MQKRGTWLRAGLTGAAAGAVNGLFGAGGGMLLLPLLHRLTDLREHEAFACSVCTMLPLSVVSLVVYWPSPILRAARWAASRQDSCCAACPPCGCTARSAR